MGNNGRSLNPSKRGLNGHNSLHYCYIRSVQSPWTLGLKRENLITLFQLFSYLKYKICLLNLTVVRSLSAEYNWVCDKADYGANVLSARSAGVVISMLIFMQLSDK